jgi:hypothetical protein
MPTCLPATRLCKTCHARPPALRTACLQVPRAPSAPTQARAGRSCAPPAVLPCSATRCSASCVPKTISRWLMGQKPATHGALLLLAAAACCCCCYGHRSLCFLITCFAPMSRNAQLASSPDAFPCLPCSCRSPVGHSTNGATGAVVCVCRDRRLLTLLAELWRPLARLQCSLCRKLLSGLR